MEALLLQAADDLHGPVGLIAGSLARPELPAEARAKAGMNENTVRYAAAGGPNQVVSASASPW